MCNDALSCTVLCCSAGRAQGQTLLDSIPCLLSPAAQADNSSNSLKLLLQAAGGEVIPNPDPQLMPPEGISGFREGDRPPGLLLVWHDENEKGGGKKGVKRVSPKDVKWAQESGYGGWPMYSKEWLVKSVLGYLPLWGEHCGVVPAA